jgi:hypothetical protein
MENKRLVALKATLNELKEVLRNHPLDSFHPGLKNEIKELEILIKKPPIPKYRWSPILPGSFESGRRS